MQDELEYLSQSPDENQEEIEKIEKSLELLQRERDNRITTAFGKRVKRTHKKRSYKKQGYKKQGYKQLVKDLKTIKKC